MNVTSRELCQELYELSGWGKSAYPYHIHDGLQKYFVYADGSNAPYIVDGTAYSLTEDEKAGEHIPAYDLGYLLRKLPPMRGGEEWALSPLIDDDYKWSIGYPEFYHEDTLTDKLFTFDDTPEDAVCRLAIALFHQQILTREGSNE